MVAGPRRRADVNWVAVDGEVVAVDPASGAVHVLSGAAAAVWQLLDGESTVGLAAAVADTFDISERTAAADLETALDLLDGVGILEHGRANGDATDD